MRAMNGHIISGTSICVDYWQSTPNQKYLHFLSHLHADHTVNLKPSFADYIYTSPFNGWLVKRWFKINPELVVSMSVGASHILYDESSESHFSITLLDANHCPGSVMFLFQGTFGNILYTGDFRYNPDVLEHPMLKSVIENDSVNRLYLDNTFAAEHCEFPPRQQVLQEVISLVRNHPGHHVVIGVRKLGKEEVMRAIALALEEKVLVSKERFKILSYLQYENLFTTESEESRIHVKEIHQINNLYLHRLQEEKGPVLTILLTALYSVMPPGLGKCTARLMKAVEGVHHLPYSDHSCHSELVEFVSKVKPHIIYPIVTTKLENNGKLGSQDSSDISDVLLRQCTWHNSVIPQSIIDLSKAPLGTDDSPRGIPGREVEEMPCSNIVSNKFTEDESGSICQSPDIVSQKRALSTLQKGCSLLTSDSSNSMQPDNATGCYTSQSLEDDDYTLMSEDELAHVNIAVACPIVGLSKDDPMTINDSNLIDSNSISLKDLSAIEKVKTPTDSPRSSSIIQPKRRHILCNSNDSEKSQYFTCSTVTPGITDDLKLLNVKDDHSKLRETVTQVPNSGNDLRDDIEDNLIHRMSVDKNDFIEKEMENSPLYLTSYEHFKSSLKPKSSYCKIVSTPYISKKRASSEISVLSPKEINSLDLGKNSNQESKSWITEMNSEKSPSADQLTLVDYHDSSDSESILTNSGYTSCKNSAIQNRTFQKKIQKNIDIAVKFSDLLGNVCQCDSDPDCFCKAVSSANRKILPSTTENTSMNEKNNSPPTNNCTKNIISNNLFYLADSSFYCDIIKGNTYKKWRNNALKSKNNVDKVAQVNNNNIWDEYDWQKIFHQK
uniref:5' exonuclease Apollo n=1 Tax=Graphocephala atropunctata TaxID=36148 RepID=A0A1B6LS16_9HEMI